MKTDIQGCSTCPPGQEQYEKFQTLGLTNKLDWRFQYDYRTPNGDLFSCVRRTLAQCREARDEWLKSKIEANPC